MKNYRIYIFLLVVAIILFSCEEISLSSVGFRTEIQINESGVSILDVPATASRIDLNGMLEVREGQIGLQLTDPQGEAAFDTLLSAPSTLMVDRQIPSQPGYWKLRYKSREGEGSINIHIFI